MTESTTIITVLDTNKFNIFNNLRNLRQVSHNRCSGEKPIHFRNINGVSITNLNRIQFLYERKCIKENVSDSSGLRVSKRLGFFYKFKKVFVIFH